jgi:hypothetical protein
VPKPTRMAVLVSPAGSSIAAGSRGGHSGRWGATELTPLLMMRAVWHSALRPIPPQLRALLPLYESFATTYRSVVGHKLAKYGLRFDDLQDPLKDEVQRASCS